MKDCLTVGSLYSGVGGVCQGFIDAGFEISWANEFDNKACQTYRLNYNHEIIEGDIWNLEPENLPFVDVLTAGFPCQPFSIAGYRKGFEDYRGNHFFKILQFLKIQNPKVVVLENVKNLTSHDKGNTFRVITDSLDQLGYRVHYKVLNTMTHANIPQNRERIFVIGFREDLYESESIGKFGFPSEIPLTTTIHDFLTDDKIDEKYYYRDDWYRFDELSSGVKSTETVYQWRRQYVRENKSNVCPTLTANMGTGGHNVPIILTKNGIRKLTPRECFNLQGFTENYKLPNNMADSYQYKQAGNAVTVKVAERVAKNILRTLNGEDTTIQTTFDFQTVE